MLVLCVLFCVAVTGFDLFGWYVDSVGFIVWLLLFAVGLDVYWFSDLRAGCLGMVSPTFGNLFSLLVGLCFV